MAKLPSLRRSDPEAPAERADQEQPPPRTERTWRRRPGTPRQSPAYTTKVEQAAEKAADATRNAAAAAAKRAQARPRTSGLASLGLVLSVVAALTVATGTLARLGIAVAVVALLVGLAGLARTGQYRVSGRTEALVAVLVALAAIAVGWLAAAGALSWLDTGTDYVQRLRDWLPGWLS